MSPISSKTPREKRRRELKIRKKNEDSARRLVLHPPPIFLQFDPLVHTDPSSVATREPQTIKNCPRTPVPPPHFLPLLPYPPISIPPQPHELLMERLLVPILVFRVIAFHNIFWFIFNLGQGWAVFCVTLLCLPACLSTFYAAARVEAALISFRASFPKLPPRSPAKTMSMFPPQPSLPSPKKQMQDLVCRHANV